MQQHTHTHIKARATHEAPRERLDIDYVMNDTQIVSRCTKQAVTGARHTAREYIATRYSTVIIENRKKNSGNVLPHG